MIQKFPLFSLILHYTLKMCWFQVIAGFPGETEEDFEALCEFLHEFRLERAGVFPYSPEPGSLAATYPDQVDEDVKRRRVELLTDLQMRIVDNYCANMVGKVEYSLTRQLSPELPSTV